MRTLGEYVVEQLEAYGVDTVFGVAGSDILGLLDALHRVGRIRFYSCHHEEVACLMAVAYAQLTGQLGVVLTHSGPGAAHLINGLYAARSDRIPVLALTGQVARQAIHTSAPQGVSLTEMMAGATCWTATVGHPDSIGEILAHAVITARALRGPVHVAVPTDLQSLPCRAALRPPIGTVPDPLPDPDTIGAAAALLNRARAPVIHVGRGARGVGRHVVELAERLAAPVIPTLMGKGVVPDAHPLVCGPLGEAGTAAAVVAARRADVLLRIGTSWWPEQSDFPAPPDAVIQIDTDPRAVGAQHPVAIPLVGAAEDILPAVLPQIRRHRPRRWLDGIQTVRQAWWEQPKPDDETAFHPRSVLDAIGRAMPEDGILTVDTGAHTLWTGGFYQARQETFLLSGRWRTMGYALPAAMAAKIARPESLVLAIQGDGGLAMTLGDLTTAARYRLPLVVVVMANGSLALEVHAARRTGHTTTGMALRNPDFAATAAAAGWIGRRLQPGHDLDGVLGDALSQDAPVLVEVPVRDLPPPFMPPG